MRKVVFASSNATYGYGPGVAGELVESTPFHCVGAPPAAILYGASKIIGEQLCRDAFANRAGLRRAALFHGLWRAPALPRRQCALHHRDHRQGEARRGPQVFGDGSETKHFVYVGDLARANRMAFESAATDVAVNISGPAPVTTLNW